MLDPDPGSSAFLAPGPDIRDPGREKTGPGINISVSLITIFKVVNVNNKILCQFRVEDRNFLNICTSKRKHKILKIKQEFCKHLKNKAHRLLIV
jgi:hypothetical protein